MYLKPNLVIEPLFMGWYAWSHLISPGTAAMNVVKRHVEIMNSYVDPPQKHMEADMFFILVMVIEKYE